MARKIGINNVLSDKFSDYSYFINGVGGVGKTTLAYEIGKKIANSNEGTLIITCGREPKPKHIEGAFYDVAPTFKAFINIVKELTTNKDEYPDTKWIQLPYNQAFETYSLSPNINPQDFIKHLQNNTLSDFQKKFLKDVGISLDNPHFSKSLQDTIKKANEIFERD